MNEIKKLTKKDQLRGAFRGTIKEFAKQTYIYIEGRNSGYSSISDIVNDCVNLLLKEVSIRTSLS